MTQPTPTPASRVDVGAPADIPQIEASLRLLLKMADRVVFHRQQVYGGAYVVKTESMNDLSDAVADTHRFLSGWLTSKEHTALTSGDGRAT